MDWPNVVYRAFYSVNTDRKLESLENQQLHDYYVKKRQSKTMKLLMLMLAKLRKRYPNATLVCALEGAGKQHRRRIWDGYKAQRVQNIEVMQTYMKSLKLLENLAIRATRAPQGEADDAIAVWAKNRHPQTEITVVSEDRDLWQVIQGDRIVVETQKLGIINASKCKEVLGVLPRNVACLKAFLGDPADNIPRAVPRMRTASIKKLAAMGTCPRDAYRAAKAQQVISTRELERVVKHRREAQRNFDLVRARDALSVKNMTGAASKSRLHRFCQQNDILIEENVIRLLTRNEREAR